MGQLYCKLETNQLSVNLPFRIRDLVCGTWSFFFLGSIWGFVFLGGVFGFILLDGVMGFFFLGGILGFVSNILFALVTLTRLRFALFWGETFWLLGV